MKFLPATATVLWINAAFFSSPAVAGDSGLRPEAGSIRIGLWMAAFWLLSLCIAYYWGKLRFEKKSRFQPKTALQAQEKTLTTHRKHREKQLQEDQALFDALFHLAPDLIFFKNCDGVYLGCNDAYGKHLGKTPEQIIGKTDLDFYPRHLAESYRAWDREVLEKMETIQAEIEIPFSDHCIIVDIIKAPMVTSDRRVLGIVGVARDISQRKRTEKELSKARERYANIFKNAVEGIFTATPDGRFLEVNPAMARMLGFDTPEQLMAEITDIASQIYVQAGQRQELLDRLMADGAVAGFEIESRRRDHSRFWMQLYVRAQFDQAKRLVRIEGMATDITDRKHHEKDLTLHATTDALTGLANRRKFEADFARMLAQAHRSGKQMGLLFIDLDGFKAINDRYGHQVGDRILVAVSRVLRSRLRETDALCRLGGDEFAVLLWDVSGAQNATDVARQLIASINQDNLCRHIACRPGASIGISLYPKHATQIQELVRFADEAMYAAKASGRNTVAMARPNANVL